MSSISPNAQAAVADAPHPFNKCNADIILRSSDLVDYRVYSQVLMAASPFFEGMFEVPQPPPEEQLQKYGLPIIRVSEDSKTLNTLLRICYPIPKPNVWDLGLIEAALRAAMKYEMEYAETILTADLQSHISRAIPPPGKIAVASTLFQVWAIACRLHLDKVALEAARCIRSWCRTPNHIDAEKFHLPRAILESPSEHLEDITAGQYFRLCRYLTDPVVDADGEVLFKLPPSTAGTADDYEECVNRVPPNPSAAMNMPPVDLICISSEGERYLVHQAVLSAASPTLRAKIVDACKGQALTPTVPPAVLPQGHAEPGGSLSSEPHRSTIPDDLPICHFDEPSHVLSHLLSSCYPGCLRLMNNDEDHPDDLPLLVRVIKAIELYELEPTLDGPYSGLRAAWRSAAHENPTRAYFVAIQCGHAGSARIAAEYVLSQGVLQLDDAAYVPEMETSPALAYRRLLQYYCSCKALGRRGFRDLHTRLLALPPAVPECSSPREPKPLKSGSKKTKSAKLGSGLVGDGAVLAPVHHTWLDNYVDGLRDAFERSPHPAMLHDLNRVLAETAGDDKPGPWCEECIILVRRLLDLDESLQKLTQEMDEVVLEI